jgi:hypothetical protein
MTATSINRVGFRQFLLARRPSLASMLSLVALQGCGWGLHMRVPDVVVVPGRTVLLPAKALAYRLDFGDNRIEEEPLTSNLQEMVDEEISRQARAKGVVPTPDEKIRACGPACVSLMATLVPWSTKAAMEIAATRAGHGLRGRDSVSDWKSRRDFGPLRKAMDADFALVVYVRDARETDGRVIGEMFSGGYTYFKQVCIACAVELASGRMVWCESKVDRRFDLRSRAGVRAMVEHLLVGL